MKINITNNYGPIIERLEKLEYNPIFNISQEDFNNIIKSVIQFSPEEKRNFGEGIEEFKKADSPEKKESVAKRIGKLFENYSIGVASKITADIITKVFLGI